MRPAAEQPTKQHPVDDATAIDLWGSVIKGFQTTNARVHAAIKAAFSLNPAETVKREDDGLNVRARVENVYAHRGFDSIDPGVTYYSGGYMVGIAESTSGKLAGPWIHQPEAMFSEGGGHPMLFRTFDGKLMMTLHSPNSGPNQRIHFFEMEDTGETLRIARRFTPAG